MYYSLSLSYFNFNTSFKMGKYSTGLKTCLASSIFFCLLVKSSSIYIPYSPCNETNTLQPCKSHPSFPRSILCEDIQNLETFVHVLRCNRKKNMQEVFLVQSTIDYLPLYILDFCGFSFLNLKTVSLSKMLEGNDMVRLEQLHLDNVTISSPWNWKPLAILTRLSRFSISNMMIKVLNENLVENLSENLQSFILTSTNTTVIAEYALEKFHNMIYISIQKNEIEHLKRSMFPRPSKIKYFYFGKNKITSLPEDIFVDMPDLQVVSLQGNLISELHQLTFKNVWNKLTYVLLDGNPLKCSCKMLWMVKKGTPSIFQGECYAPKAQFGKELKNLKVSDFRCF